MEARILRLQELAKHRKFSMQEFEMLRHESHLRDEQNRREEYITNQIQKIPFRFRGKIFSSYQVKSEEQAKIKKIAERFVATFPERLKDGSCLIFYGNSGTGKTLLSLIICQALLNNGYKIQFESSLEFIKKLLEIKFKSQSAFESAITSHIQSQFLILDEVTESVTKDGGPSEIEKQILFQLINKRYENNLGTLVISNRNYNEICERLSVPIFDRLKERSITLAFNWESYRSGEKI